MMVLLLCYLCLISLEGGEGVGKIMVINVLCDVLYVWGYEVLLICEFGGMLLVECICVLVLIFDVEIVVELLLVEVELLLVFVVCVQYVCEVIQLVL